jgi:hypothetical protein
VDNFVGNWASWLLKAAPRRGFNRLMKNWSVKKRYKSMGCTNFRVFRQVFPPVPKVAAAGARLWSSTPVHCLQTPVPAHV